ncbi:MAG: serine/threonine protein kinase, partial [Blastocatellia bacterium]|nr:serine/threonine protein kinase [Blastocatellia bacterium]
IAYLVMELLEGYSLWEELQKCGYLSLRRPAEILTPVCQALAEAHRLGIVHRDIKPANIFLHRTGEGEVVKVVDFGIAKLVGEAGSGAGYDLTATGGIVGTPTYMAPERLSGKAYDGKSDVYSLGVMLYEMLCGRPPFVAEENAYQVILAHLQESPPSLRQFNPNLPEAIETVILEALAKSPADRPGPLLLAEQFADAARPHLGKPEEASLAKITGEYRYEKLTGLVQADTAEDTATVQVPLADAPTVTIKQKEALRSQDAPTETFQGIPSDR